MSKINDNDNNYSNNRFKFNAKFFQTENSKIDSQKYEIKTSSVFGAVNIL